MVELEPNQNQENELIEPETAEEVTVLENQNENQDDNQDESLGENQECAEKEKRKISLPAAVYAIVMTFFVTVCLTVIGTVLVIDRMGGNTLGLSYEGWNKLKWGFGAVDEMYYENADETKLVDGALIGLSYALDEYSVYMPAENVEEFLDTVNAEDYSGAGMYIYSDTENDCVKVSSTLPGSPAEKAGIKVNDIIVAVDGEKVGTDVDKASSLLMGEDGSEVKVTLIRAESGKTEEIKIIRAEIHRDIVSSKMLKDNIGYIKVTSFGTDTYENFVDEYEELDEKGMKKLIIDLRDNPGGYVDSVTSIADLFLEKDDLIISTKNGQGHVTEYRASEKCFDIEIVIICNEDSASASEILTVALRDNGKAKVVGAKTFGKGVTQVMISHEDGSMFKITDTRYYTPKDVCIDKKGVEPDVKVEDDMGTDKDEQLEAAIEILLKK